MTLFVADLDRDVVRIAGPDAATYLQGQVSQDVLALKIGDSAFSFLLEPQGKVVVWGRITREADDSFLFDVDAGYGDALVARLNRFKLRTKATIEQVPLRVIALRGDLGPVITGDDVVASPFEWPDFEGVDLIGRAPHVSLPHTEISQADYDARRVAAGVPRLGAELDHDTIPGEAGALVIERSVSFTKGCYTGQELVARVDSRGSNTPRRVRRVVFAAPVAAGTTLTVDGNDAGMVTSSGGTVVLAMIKRSAFDATHCQAGDLTGDFF